MAAPRPRAAALASRIRARWPVSPGPPPLPTHAARSSNPVDGASNADGPAFEAALAVLLAVPASSVAPTARATAPVALTLPFMLWLAEREDGETDAAAKAALAAVGAALTAAREGLDGATPPLPPVPAPLDDDAAIEAAVAARWRALGVARSPATAALAPAALAAGASAAAALSAHLTHRKAASAAALMGRVRLTPDAAAAALAGAAAGDAAGRILGLLLGEADREARLAILPDAFDPGEEVGTVGDADTPSSDTEQVWTTPLQLVAAVDLALGRLADKSADAAPGKRTPLPPLTLAGGCPAAPEGGDQLIAVLEEIRAAALEFVK